MQRTTHNSAIRAHFLLVGFSILATLLMPHESSAEVRLPKLVGDNMVLQRDQEIRIWGFADAGESVRVSFRGEAASTSADASGFWSVSLKPQIAGGPDPLIVAGRNTITLENILVGDVWLASGQSNMEFSMKEADGASAAIAAATDSNIRLFRLPHDASVRSKRDLLGGVWTVATPDTVTDFSAVAFLFARRLRDRYQVPIGVIESSWGGTYAESWMSAEALRPFPDFADRLRQLQSFGPKDEADYARYLDIKAHWNALHRSEDRGTVDGRPLWADPSLDASSWSLIDVPRPDSAWGTDFDGFDGTVWFRREIVIPPSLAGMDLELHLGAPYHTAQAFYDGQPVETLSEAAGTYRAGGNRVHAGRSVIAQRLTGGGGYIMLSGKAEDVFALAGGVSLPLAGKWSYRPGPELGDFPKPAALAPYYGFPGIAVLSNAMIEPLTPLRIKGVIWYQGESNVGAAELYRRLFPALIIDWRRRWGMDFPFLFVQLAGYSPDGAVPGGAPWAELREAQEAALALPYTGMATAVDIGNVDNVHPKNKRDVALRLSLAAARVAYGEKLLASGPTFRSMQIEGRRIRLRFDHVGAGLLVKDRYGYPRGFSIAPKDGPFVWAKAILEGDTVVVYGDAVAHPVAVRYDWANTPDGNLYNREGLPAIPFRSDGPLHPAMVPTRIRPSKRSPTATAKPRSSAPRT